VIWVQPAYITEISMLHYFEPKSQHAYYGICYTLAISGGVKIFVFSIPVWGLRVSNQAEFFIDFQKKLI
jgi:hypothetical protein